MAGCSALAVTAGAASQVKAQEDFTVVLDTVTILATKEEESAIDSLSASSVVGGEELERQPASDVTDLLDLMPSVDANDAGDDPGIGINVRGLQDFGRVSVNIDGARQNFQVFEHGPAGKVYIDPELLSQVSVVRGPVSNVYGSGAIGGVVSFDTKDVDDIVLPGDRYGFRLKGFGGTNGPEGGGSFFAASRLNDSVEAIVGLSAASHDDYRDGNGDTAINTGEDTLSGLAKLTMRPADGHEVKLGFVGYGAEFGSGEPGDPADTTDSSEYDNEVLNTIVTANWHFQRPENPWVDLNASAYWSHTKQDRTVVEQLLYPFNPGADPTAPDCFEVTGCDFTGPVGTRSGYTLDTYGFDVHNTSRFHGSGLWAHAVTFGADLFRDEAEATGDLTTDDAGYQLTGSGERTAGGAFLQWHAEYDTWLDIIAAARYDTFDLSGDAIDQSGSRLSPKITVGVTPVEGLTLYGTYAEGYRAPALTETVVSGFHPGAIFRFLPNPDLKPEIGKTFEAGINFKKDGLFTQGDAFRAKFSAFHNDVTDFIDLTVVNMGPTSDCFFGPFGPQCYQYQNISSASIGGVELEASYDAGWIFAGLAASIVDGEDDTTGDRLISIAPHKLVTTLGFRSEDRTWSYGVRWYAVGGRDTTPGTGNPPGSDSFHLVNLFAAWQPSQDMIVRASLENIFDEQYRPYLDTLPGPGIAAKASVEWTFGG